MKNKKNSMIFALLLIVFTAMSCDNNSNTSNDSNNPLVGKFSWNEWKEKANWEDYSASDYTPNPTIMQELKKIISNNSKISFVLFTSNWCPDCKSQMPKTIKVLLDAGYEISKLEIYGLDYKKQEPSGAWAKYDIKRVPTLLVFENELEKGRIIEYPNKSIEEDILDFLITK